MKLFLSCASVLLLTASLWAQSMAGSTQYAAVLPNMHGEIIQYAFPVSPFSGWDEYSHKKKFTFSGANTVQLETAGGLTELYLSDMHDFCSPNAGPNGYCSFLGTGTLTVEAVTVPSGGSYQHVVGYFVGSFVDVKDNFYSDVTAILSFDTFPATDGVPWAAHGGVTVVLADN
jgi:hypothetical protein